MTCERCGGQKTPMLFGGLVWWCSPCGMNQLQPAPTSEPVAAAIAETPPPGVKPCQRCRRIKKPYIVCGVTYWWCFACQYEAKPKQGALFT
jgi:hypothetical protein